MSQILKKQFIVGTIWSLSGTVGYLLVSLITNVILARIIGPQAFGQIGIIMFFIIIAKVLTESGLSGAIIRKKEVSEEDYSTVFIFNLIISFILCILLILSAHSIAKFYNDNLLKDLLIATSFVLIINAFQIVNNARLVRNLNYKKKSIVEFVAVIISSIVAIVLATVFQAGVWAVVVLQLLTALLITIQLWIYFGPLKTIIFSKKSFGQFYRFGLNTTLASLLNTAFDNIYQLILGKYFAITQTGLFYQAKKLQEVPVGIIKSTTLGVIFSALSKVQDDLDQFGRIYNRIVTLFTIAIGFICLFVFFYAKEIILLLYGANWAGAVFYMQILIVASYFYMQEMLNRNIFKVFDRTEKILHLEIFKKVFQALTILVGVAMRNIEILLYGFLLTSVVSYFVNYYYSRKVFGGFSWFEILMVLKVFFIGTSITVVGNLLKITMSLNGNISFVLLPAFIVLYAFLIKILHVSNIFNEIKYLKKLIVN